MGRRVRDFIEISDYTSLDSLINTLVAIRDNLPEEAEAELKLRGPYEHEKTRHWSGAPPGLQRQGSTRILVWCSGLASSANAPFTSASPTLPVISGGASTLPSASRCSERANSSGV